MSDFNFTSISDFEDVLSFARNNLGSDWTVLDEIPIVAYPMTEFGPSPIRLEISWTRSNGWECRLFKETPLMGTKFGDFTTFDSAVRAVKSQTEDWIIGKKHEAAEISAKTKEEEERKAAIEQFKNTIRESFLFGEFVHKMEFGQCGGLILSLIKSKQNNKIILNISFSLDREISDRYIATIATTSNNPISVSGESLDSLKTPEFRDCLDMEPGYAYLRDGCVLFCDKTETFQNTRHTYKSPRNFFEGDDPDAEVKFPVSFYIDGWLECPIFIENGEIRCPNSFEKYDEEDDYYSQLSFGENARDIYEKELERSFLNLQIETK